MAVPEADVVALLEAFGCHRLLSAWTAQQVAEVCVPRGSGFPNEGLVPERVPPPH
jgi:hypothetical protein